MRFGRPVHAMALAAVSAALSLTVSLRVFPHLSVDSDEGVYLLQADALRHGHLFPPAPEPAAAFQPWLAVTRGHHYVTKYTPVQPAMFALARILTGHERSALPAIAAGTVIVTYFLARRLLHSERQGLLAAALMAASPLFVLQTATYLPYAGTLLLLGAFTLAVLKATDEGDARWAVAAGLLLGIAVFSRPFDTFIFALPIVAWLVSRRRLTLLWLAGGATGPLMVMALYFRAATGSPFRSPFRLLDPSDSVGFGDRRMLPNVRPLHYGPLLGLDALATHALLLSCWICGGLLLVAFTIWAARSLRHRPGTIPFALIAVTVPLGYVFFWGSYGALTWGGPFQLGPYYWMPILLPLSVLGAHGASRLARAHPHIAVPTFAASLVLAAGVAAQALHAANDYSASDRVVWATIEKADLHNAVVFLEEPQLGHPIQMARNSANLEGDILWALDRGGCANAAVLRTHPHRNAYLLLMDGHYRSRPPDPRLRVRLEPHSPQCETGA